MKTFVSLLLVASILWTIVPESAGDLPNYNDGTTGNINVGTVTASTSVVVTNASSGNPIQVNGNTSNTWLANLKTNGVSVGGWTNNGALLVTDGTVANPSIAWASDYDGGATGFYRSGQNQVAVAINGANLFTMKANDINITTGNQLAWNDDMILRRKGAAAFQLGTDGASPINQEITACNGSGTDKSGASLTIEGGQSTGTGVPGDLIYRTSLYTNSSGSAANAFTTRATIVGRPCALTNATATSFQRFTMATNTTAGIALKCTVYVSDGSFNRQSKTSAVLVDAVNVSGTITAVTTEVDNTTAANSGTLTIAYTVVDEGSNVLAIRANANSSLTTPTVRIKWSITSLNSDGAITVTPVQL